LDGDIEMDKEKLLIKYKKAEQLAKKLGATKVWISYDTFLAEFGKSFYGQVEVRADIKYGSVYDVEISGASFRFDKKQSCLTFMKNLQNAIKVYDVLR